MNITPNIKPIITALCKGHMSIDLIACAYDVSVKTVKSYVSTLEKRPLGLEQAKGMTHTELTEHCYPDRLENASFKVFPDDEWLAKQLKRKGAKIKAIWRLHCASLSPKEAPCYSWFCSHVKAFKKASTTFTRLEYQPGDVAMIDVGGTRLPAIKSDANNTFFRPYLFAACLPASGLVFFYPIERLDSDSWIKGCKAFFEYIGGIPRAIICDNAKALIIKSGIISQASWRLQYFADFSNFLICPARARKPQDKPLVELIIGWFKAFASIELGESDLATKDDLVGFLRDISNRMNNELFQRQSFSRFDEFLDKEKATLAPIVLPWPELPSKILHPKVDGSGFVNVNAVKYSVPYGYANQPVDVRVFATSVAIFSDGKEIATHDIAEPGTKLVFVEEHLSPKQQHQFSLNYQYYLDWADALGSGVIGIVERAFAGETDANYASIDTCRRARSLAKNYSSEDFNAACEFTLGTMDSSLRGIKLLQALKANLDSQIYRINPLEIGSIASHKSMPHVNTGGSYHDA